MLLGIIISSMLLHKDYWYRSAWVYFLAKNIINMTDYFINLSFCYFSYITPIECKYTFTKFKSNDNQQTHIHGRAAI